jgi:hypothetical protein
VTLSPLWRLSCAVSAGRVHGEVEFRAGNLKVVPRGGVAGIEESADVRRALGAEDVHGLPLALILTYRNPIGKDSRRRGRAAV